MFMAKNLAEFHFDTTKSGIILQSFLSDAKISFRSAEKLLGISYDTIVDTLRGRNKDSKMEFVVKVCAITGHTIQDWCERMLESVDADLAQQIRAVFTPQSAPLPPSVDEVITHCLDVQEHSAEHYQAILRACYDELRVSKDEMRKQYEEQIAYLMDENRRLLSALINNR